MSALHRDRIQHAWSILGEWATKWYVTSPNGMLYRTHSGPRAEIYLPDLSPDRVSHCLSILSQHYGLAELRLETEPSRVPPPRSEELKQLVKQISTGKIEFIRGEFGAAARQVSIGLRLLVQPAPHNLLDIRLLWDAVDTFFNQPDLKRAFESVFDWFFDFQEIVGAPNLYFLCGAGLAPRSDPGSLIQL